jgi:hypothetical protein
MWNFVGQNWGNIASVAGLIFSFLAFVFSKRASNAAKEARELALSRSLGEDMNNANRIAADAVAYIRAEKSEMALIRMAELISLTSYIITRWDVQLPVSSKNRLISSREQLRIVHDLLDRVKGREIVAEERAILTKFCRDVPTVFTEEYGKAISRLDRRN